MMNVKEECDDGGGLQNEDHPAKLARILHLELTYYFGNILC